MALRNQPYIPLYVQDYLTDEKLNECSASTQGIYIKIMCLLHKSSDYGSLLLKQKDKQTDKPIKNFANKIVKHLPFSLNEIEQALFELIDEDVLQLNKSGNDLSQKRMIQDNILSIKRATAGSKGGKKTQFAKAKIEANPEDEDEIENINEVYNNVLKTWNFFAGKYDLSKIIKLSDKRKGNIKARFREKEFDLIVVLKSAEKQPFLLGDNEKGWSIDFDWIFGSQNNYLKVLEEKYTEKNNGTHKSVITKDGFRRIAENIANDSRLDR